MDWHYVEKGDLPDSDCDVLAWIDYNPNPFESYAFSRWENGKFNFYGNGKVIAWIKIPEPPRRYITDPVSGLTFDVVQYDKSTDN